MSRATATAAQPDMIDKDHGLIVNLIQEMDKLPGGPRYVLLDAFPFQRSIKNITDGMADLHQPLLLGPAIPAASLDNAHSTSTFTNAPFGLYLAKSNTRLKPDNIKDFKAADQAFSVALEHLRKNGDCHSARYRTPEPK